MEVECRQDMKRQDLSSRSQSDGIWAVTSSSVTGSNKSIEKMSKKCVSQRFQAKTSGNKFCVMSKLVVTACKQKML